jgi:hypothetical protein
MKRLKVLSDWAQIFETPFIKGCILPGERRIDRAGSEYEQRCIGTGRQR